jgi:hypothetical protein
VSGNEHFLSRWSRLKQEAKQPAHGGEQARPDDDAGAAFTDAQIVEAAQRADGSAVERSLAKGEVEPFDVQSLPPVDMIEATTDIRAFLTKGVPAELTKAALRRAWSSDPAIRDFVGLSENAWDFNAPETIPGFGGTIAGEEVQRILVQMMPSAPPAGSHPEAEAEASESEAVAEGASVPAQTSGNTPQEKAHALVKIVTESEQAGDEVDDRQTATIENKNEDVAVQETNNSSDIRALSSEQPAGRMIQK